MNVECPRDSTLCPNYQGSLPGVYIVTTPTHHSAIEETFISVIRRISKLFLLEFTQKSTQVLRLALVWCRRTFTVCIVIVEDRHSLIRNKR